MPYIVDSYEHYNMTRAAAVAWKVVKNHAGTIQTDYIMKEASDLFFADLTTTLTKTGLDITFSPTNYQIKIFNTELYIPTTPMHYSTTANDPQAAVPQCFKDGFYDLHRGLLGSYIRNNAATTYWGNGNAVHIKMSIFDNVFSKNSMHYKIMVYYKDNYLMVQYATPQNLVVPLFCIIKGTLKNSPSEVIYLSANPNLHYHGVGDTTNHSNAVYKTFNRDIIGYRDYGDTYMPASHTIYIDGQSLFYYPDGTTPGYVGQQNIGIYFHTERPDRLALDLRAYQNSERYYIKPVKLFNDQINFPNFYYGDEKMEHDKFYEINNTDYYCPGDVLDSTNRSLLNQCGWPTFLLKL